MGTTLGKIGGGRPPRRPDPPIKSDLPPEVSNKGVPTEAQKAMVLREAVSTYIRLSFRAPDVRQICEDFVAAIDQQLRDNVEPPLPDVPAVAIDPTSATIPASGGIGHIDVAITEPGESGTWTVEKDATADWLTYTPMTPQSTDGTITYTVTANPAFAARVAHFYINGQTFTLNQDAAEPAVVSISPTTATVLAEGGGGSIAVTVTTAGVWSVDPSMPGWVTCTPTTPQSADGTVDYTAAVNTTGLPRQALIDINGQTFTLNQGAV
jgi:hypothetical protein